MDDPPFSSERVCQREAISAIALQRWVHELRVDIINLGIEGGGTGSDAANTKIREWAPQALIIEG